MTAKIFRSTFTASIAVLLASLIVILGVLYGYFSDFQERQLRAELELASQGVEQNGESYLSSVNTGNFRFTWIDEDGTVLFDTQSNAANMENHLDREEIQEALKNGTGESSRFSSTLMEETLYYARLLEDGTVLRVSADQATVFRLLVGMLQPLIIVILLAVILSLLLAKRMANRVVTPLNDLDLDHPLENNAYDELSPLLRRINQQHIQINEQIQALQRKNDEFTQITGNMNEGLVLLNSDNIILSINPAAQKLFNTDSSCVGKDFLTVDRTHDMNHIIQEAFTDGHGEMRAQRNGKEYQFNVSRIESDGAVVGAVLLAFDVTAQAFAERNRKEFTANVSHELKTPLQSILGSAELIENGLAAQTDIPRFAGHIRTEAGRLVTLIDDIIRLSQLDEKADMPYENVNLYEIATEVVNTLHDTAAAKNVQLDLKGENVYITGVKRLVWEILYNLCDNAIKYNVDGGSAEISVKEQENSAVIAVRDTGIGIPPEHQSRVFERFYRVDKSHSKESGGTGLGLSIVKHAVQYMDGKISLQSKPGKGTEISIFFTKSAGK